MFSTIGRLKHITCPNKQECDLFNCFFSHDTEPKLESPTALYDPLTLPGSEVHDEPPAKKRRLSDSVPVKHAALIVQTAEKPRVATKVRPVPDHPKERHGFTTTLSQPLNSSIRPVSPPPKTKPKQTLSAQQGKSDLKEEKLLPRTVSRDPVPFPTRLAILTKLHKFVGDTNTKFGATSDKASKLTPAEATKLALDEEQAIASGNTSIDGYKNNAAQRLTAYRKMSEAQWIDIVRLKFRQGTDAAPSTKNESSPVETGLSERQEIVILNKLQTKIVGLEQHGYVTSPPSEQDVQKAKAATEATAGWEQCDRCNTRFQVFPGRNEEGLLTTRGKCTFHWAKPVRSKREVNWPCCQQTGGATGCTEMPTHVFKVEDPKRLATIWQFESTPTRSDASINPQPLAFDCEMSYTTYGMEVVRLTALAWPSKAVLLDILVRPFGEILDFNTRFSGVSAEVFRNATPFDGSTLSIEMMRKQSEQGLLYMVKSPKEARRLLFNLLSPETPLIGHAIENDLNVCRIIHPFIIDTVLLFPHPRGLPIRQKLKFLAGKYLDKQIQTGGEAGHDSKEDSVATADLVLVKVKERWQNLRSSGWTWMDDELVGPAAKL